MPQSGQQTGYVAMGTGGFYHAEFDTISLLVDVICMAIHFTFSIMTHTDFKLNMYVWLVWPHTYNIVLYSPELRLYNPVYILHLEFLLWCLD